MVYPSASRSVTLRLKFKNKIGMLGQITSAIGGAGGDIGAIDIVSVDRGGITRDITVSTRDEAHTARIVEAVKRIPGVEVVHLSDRTFLLHLGGKIEIANRIPIKTRDDLSRVYTPGVAQVCRAIQEDKGKAFALTIKKNSVAVVTDGSAVLGLGNIGPEAALPVMEGKAMLFKEFAGIDAYPICLATQDPDEIVETVQRIATGFGGINLEDISSPRCFEIERRLKKTLDIPVFHDDQHGTAVVVLAALLNAVRIVKKKREDLKVVVNGVGAAGTAIIDMLLSSGVKRIIGCDRDGILCAGRRVEMNPVMRRYAKRTNPERVKGKLEDALVGADVFIGVSVAGILHAAAVKKMARDPIVFALANPSPEIMPEETEGIVRIMATGRSDYPNQINNVLAFPGIFRGALDVRASEINDAMNLAAAEAIASVIRKDELSEDYIVPGVFNRKVAKVVAQAVSKAATETGVARREKKITNNQE
ncbi:NAD-dependent malic enzyme [Candidatus Manganitrophus noduliformans]|uniref:NAD-dependent malic enzyme n=1 Tax=Candidatus Manganitrophus noduliformans TaxID=2606439 RepID=A0A7X6DQG6_9BACT|nr:malic enzyme-like NAD(P)-binding protein [Candidatus Manganitrophus noduliformans]NKE71518.1 NAD-dependent malic enzyme [Candidatus Manganitrophus noduliformans]